MDARLGGTRSISISRGWGSPPGKGPGRLIPMSRSDGWSRSAIGSRGSTNLSARPSCGSMRGAPPFAGFIADRVKRVHLILGGCIFWSFVTVATAWCSKLWQFVAVRGISWRCGRRKVSARRFIFRPRCRSRPTTTGRPHEAGRSRFISRASPSARSSAAGWEPCLRNGMPGGPGSFCSAPRGSSARPCSSCSCFSGPTSWPRSFLPGRPRFSWRSSATRWARPAPMARATATKS